MVKLPYMYSDSDTEETTSQNSTISKNVIKKIRFSVKFNYSILKYTDGNVKKKFKALSKSESDDMAYSSSNRRKAEKKFPSILKYREDTKDSFKEEEEESESISEPVEPLVQPQYLVERVPRPKETKPGRGERVALIVKKNVTSIPLPQVCSTSPKRAKSARRVTKKRSY